MKFTLATILLPFLTGTLAAPNEQTVNGVKLHTINTNGAVFSGEPPSTLDANACTECVGHHGLCTIGEGNCYAPDGCYFCGDCDVNSARCQNPDAEPCQCY